MLSSRLRFLTVTCSCRTSRYLVNAQGTRQVCTNRFSEIVAGQCHVSGPYRRTLCTAATRAGYHKDWQDAASLMIVAEDSNQPKDSVFDYRMLFLKRQGGSNAFAGATVFPGGVIDDADFSPEWMQVFSQLGIETVDSFGWEHLKNKPRAGPITSPRAKDHLPNDVAFRLCAIRETFEESGILIASTNDDVQQSMKKVSAKTFAPSSCYKGLEENKFLEWRQKIYHDASQFLVMCQELKIFPNLWSLFEMSNLLTPRTYPRRYDTIFYLSTLDSMPRVIIDEKEMASDQWLNPAEGIQHYCQQDRPLIPPQIIECARCVNFPRLVDVENYAAKIMDEGMEINLPVGFYLKDSCLISTFPGDDCYPENVSHASISEIPKLDETEEENLKRCKNLHRFTFYHSKRPFKFDCIKLPQGNHSPQSFNCQDWVNKP